MPKSPHPPSDHDDVIKWKDFPRYWPFVRVIQWSPVNSPHKGQWCAALMFSFIFAWINVPSVLRGPQRTYHGLWVPDIHEKVNDFESLIKTLNVRGPSCLGLTWSISWLLMTWLLASPGHQQPWYWLCRIGRSLSYLSKDFNYLCHANVEEWHKM